MAGGLGAISATKRRMKSQGNLPINASGNRVSSSTTISHLPPPVRTKGFGEGQDPEIQILEEDSPISSPKRNKLKDKVEISNLRSEFVAKDKKIDDATLKFIA
ncbi:hypothetical protein AHAS_Ahas13G0272800 [Arachis hypogaea]